MVFTQQTLSDMGICAGIFIVAAIYYVIYLRPRQKTNWVMLEPAQGDDAETTVAEVSAGN